MQNQFYALADNLTQELKRDEIFTCWFSGECSDFVRFNHGQIRQAGNVTQRYLRLRLIAQGRQASLSLTIAGDSGDLALARSSLAELRAILDDLPEDPYLLYATDIHSSENKRSSALPSPEESIEQITTAAQGLDLVGIYAAGTICRGFANSLGQRNWHEVEN
ncbi:MAG: TldE/PmbA family protein, partial [Pseudomonadota bacterium]|nr:TldE/PmbA family protein [Pseudomonadota bacterium]